MRLAKHIFWGIVRRGVYAAVVAVLSVVIVRAGQALFSEPIKSLAYWLTLGLANFGLGWSVGVVAYLRDFHFICHVCQNPDEPLGLLSYWRGHGAHEWHQGYVR